MGGAEVAEHQLQGPRAWVDSAARGEERVAGMSVVGLGDPVGRGRQHRVLLVDVLA